MPPWGFSDRAEYCGNTPPTPDNSGMNDAAERRLWEFRWVRDLVVLAVVVLIIMAAYSIRAILTPVLIGLVLAYVCNPLIVWMHERWKMPRWAGVSALLGGFAFLVLTVLLYVAPPLVVQGVRLVRRLPAYFERISTQLGIDWVALRAQAIQSASGSSHGGSTTAATTQAADDGTTAAAAVSNGDALGGLDIQTAARVLLRGLGMGLDIVGSVVSLTTYLGLFAVLVSIAFFLFGWKLDLLIKGCVPYLPKKYEADLLPMIAKMDRTVSAFIRGRLIQSAVMAIVLSAGWWAFGVPYWLLLGVMGGLLNLVPFAAVLAGVAAVALAVAESLGGDGLTLWAVALPLLVYVAAQSLDGWVVEPIVQGSATELDPLVVTIVVVAGGALAGVAGMILAIPVAACVKILAQDLLLPKIRQDLSEFE